MRIRHLDSLRVNDQAFIPKEWHRFEHEANNVGIFDSRQSPDIKKS